MTFKDIKQEFDFSFGYIRNDMRAICRGDARIQYTLMLLVCCSCEMLAAARGNPNYAANEFSELLPHGDWRQLSERLFTALRNGLAHGFDTKHLVVDGVSVQIYFQWEPTAAIQILDKCRLVLAPRVLAETACRKIDDLEEQLKKDNNACDVWYRSAHLRERETILTKNEVPVWQRLLAAL